MSSESDYRPMMNVNNNETQLGLTLGYSVPSIQTKSSSSNNNNNNNNNNSGAGVNAGSSINIAFVASNPLSELVWSPSKGLRLKCADKKTAFLWDVGPSNAAASPAHTTDSNDEKTIAEETSIPKNNKDAKNAGFESAPCVRKFGGRFGSCHEAQTQNDGNSVEANTVEGVKDERLDQVKNEDESVSQANAEKLSRRTTDLLPLIDTASKPERLSGNSNKIEDIATSSRPLGLEIAMDTQTPPVEELGREVQSDARGQNSGPLLDKMESSAENDLLNDLPNERDDNDSNESMESCSSTALFSKGKKRFGFEPAMFVGSKKMRRDIQGSPSSSLHRPDSSFMNWISNMVNGIPKSKHPPSLDSDDNRIVAGDKTDDPSSKTTGFRTIFHSIRNPNTKQEENRQLNEEKTGPLEVGLSSMRPWFFPFKGKDESAENILESKSSDEKEIENKGYINDPSANLWVTRFSTKTPILPFDKKSSEGKEFRNEGPSTESSVGLKRFRRDEHQDPTVRVNPIASSQALKSSGEMASIFAKRLDALKHIMSSDMKNDETRSKKIITCFFCGRSGHGLRDCSDVKKTELEDLLGRISSYDKQEQPRCFCIRCFQLDHWAITCPFVSSTRQSKYDVIYDEKKTRMSSNVKIISEEKRESENLDWKETLDTPKWMFDMIRKLRLSRGDVLKWIRSRNSVADLDGFFVRLRLGKWEGGHGGTGYYVASITGMERGESSEQSKNSVGVSVGGIKCLVETQYVSNQDFLEDELKAWWKITSSSGKIPNEAELKWKIEERKNLGL